VNVLTRHWELKVLALVVSMVLWAFVMTSEKADVVVAAPIELDGIPAGLEVRGSGRTAWTCSCTACGSRSIASAPTACGRA